MIQLLSAFMELFARTVDGFSKKAQVKTAKEEREEGRQKIFIRAIPKATISSAQRESNVEDFICGAISIL